MNAMDVPQRNKQKNLHIELEGVKSSILCSNIVCSLIKYILTQKKQIPYPYEYLQFIASKDSKETEDFKSYKMIRQYRQQKKAVEFYKNVEDIFKGLHSELKNGGADRVREIVILLGATPVSPKEIYRIKLPSEGWICSDVWSKAELSHYMRCIIMNEILQEMICKHILPTNMFILIKKPIGMCSDWTYPKDNYTLPLKISPVTISLNENKINSCRVENTSSLVELNQIHQKDCVSDLITGNLYKKDTNGIGQIHASNTVSSLQKSLTSTEFLSGRTTQCYRMLIPIPNKSINSSDICIVGMADKLNNSETIITSSFIKQQNYFQTICSKYTHTQEMQLSTQIKDPEEMIWYQSLCHIKAFKHMPC